MADVEDIVLWVTLIAAAIFVWAWNPAGFFSNEVMVYRAGCYEFNPETNDCIAIGAAGRQTYKINEARAEVVYVPSDLDKTAPRHLVDCIIMDRRNWVCDYPDRSGSVALRDGLERRTHWDKMNKKFFVLKYQWWAIRLAAFLGFHDLKFLVPNQYDTD